MQPKLKSCNEARKVATKFKKLQPNLKSCNENTICLMKLQRNLGDNWFVAPIEPKVALIELKVARIKPKVAPIEPNQ